MMNDNASAAAVSRPKGFAALSFLREWILPFFIEIVAVVAVIKFIFFFAFVPTGSMLPTISLKSWIFSSHVYSEIQRGDIMVFDSDELDMVLIKRVVGLPGEHVDIHGNDVYIDGKLLDEPYVKNETHYAFELSFDVPEGCYLFLGDNRANSKDARYWENPYIPKEKISGKALFTVLPLDQLGILK